MTILLAEAHCGEVTNLVTVVALNAICRTSCALRMLLVAASTAKSVLTFSPFGLGLAAIVGWARLCLVLLVARSASVIDVHFGGILGCIFVGGFRGSTFVQYILQSWEGTNLQEFAAQIIVSDAPQDEVDHRAIEAILASCKVGVSTEVFEGYVEHLKGFPFFLLPLEKFVAINHDVGSLPDEGLNGVQCLGDRGVIGNSDGDVTRGKQPSSLLGPDCCQQLKPTFIGSVQYNILQGCHTPPPVLGAQENVASKKKFETQK